MHLASHHAQRLALGLDVLDEHIFGAANFALVGNILLDPLHEQFGGYVVSLGGTLHSGLGVEVGRVALNLVNLLRRGLSHEAAAQQKGQRHSGDTSDGATSIH